MGVTPTTMSNWERGESAMSLPYIIKMVDAYELCFEELIGRASVGRFVLWRKALEDALACTTLKELRQVLGDDPFKLGNILSSDYQFVSLEEAQELADRAWAHLRDLGFTKNSAPRIAPEDATDRGE